MWITLFIFVFFSLFIGKKILYNLNKAGDNIFGGNFRKKLYKYKMNSRQYD